MTSYFPDVNVWIALACEGHQHHGAAGRWFRTLRRERAFFSRLTELGFLRLLTNASVMKGEVCTQREAWRVYDRLTEDERVAFVTEPQGEALEGILRRLTNGSRPAPNPWADAYVVALAAAAGLTVVSFDRALARLSSGSCVLLA